MSTAASAGKAEAAPPDPLVLVGNPNVGKSVLFGALTGSYVTVSNYPGTTVEISQGHAALQGGRRRVLDTPGTNSLVPLSEDEAVTRDVLLAHKVSAVLQVCDAKNLRRALLLTSQLAETGVPLALCLNMADEAAERGIEIDAAALSEILGIPVVTTVATRRQGLDALRGAVAAARPARPPDIAYPQAAETALSRIEPHLPQGLPVAPRALGLMVLCSDETEDPTLWEQLEEAAAGESHVHGHRHIGHRHHDHHHRHPGSAHPRSHQHHHGHHHHDAAIDQRLAPLRTAREQAVRALGEPPRAAIARARLDWADGVLARVQRRSEPSLRVSLARRFGDLAIHPVWGVPILAAVLFLAYWLVGGFGAGTAVEFLEETVFGAYLVPWTEALVRFLVPDGSVERFLVGPPGEALESGGLLVGRYGLVSMALSYGIAIVLPIVATFFVFFSVVEDSGYLPRLAVLLNRAFKAVGLNGKAVLPMVLGLGCDTMATMTTRILETRKERLLVTLLLALGVPCSAQLGVILGMVSALSLKGVLWWAASVVLTVLLVAWLAAKVLPGKGSDFLLELPPIRRPHLANIAVKTVARVEWYLREALPLFVLGTFLLWGLDQLGLLAALERATAPVIQGLLGLPREATSAFIIGFLRRDYGAAGLFALFQPSMQAGALPPEVEIQMVVAMVTITLFIPCVAQFLVIVKERGLKTAVAMAGFIFPFAVAVGGTVSYAMRHWG